MFPDVLHLHSAVHLCGSSIKCCLVCSSSFFRHWYLALTSLIRCWRCSNTRSLALTNTPSWHTQTEKVPAEWKDFIYLYISRGATCKALSAGPCLTFTRLHTFTPHRFPVGPQLGMWDTEPLRWTSWGLSGFLKAAAGKIYLSCYFLPPSFPKLNSFPLE